MKPSRSSIRSTAVQISQEKKRGASTVHHSGRESSIVDPMRLADWPMAYIGDMVPLAL